MAAVVFDFSTRVDHLLSDPLRLLYGEGLSPRVQFFCIHANVIHLEIDKTTR